LNGQYAFVLSGRGAGADIYNYKAYIGTVTFDGAGGITSGEFESSITTGGETSNGNINPANSSYSVGSDNRGCAVLSADTDLTIRFSLGAIQSGTATKGRIIEFEDPTSTAYIAAGQFLKQGTAWFSTPLSGNYVAAGSGWDTSGGRFALAGAVLLSGGSSSNGELDWNEAGTLQHSTGLGGTVNDYGNGIIQGWMFGTQSYVSLRKVSQSQLLFKAFVWIDYPSRLGALAFGEMRQQSGTFDDSSLNGVAVFAVSRLAGSGSGVTIGTFTGNGSGSGSVTVYDDDAGTLTSGTNPCAYAVASNGRTTLSSCGGDVPTLYLTATNTAFMLSGNQGVTFGQAEPQAAGPFDNTSVSGTFFMGTDAVVSHSQETEVGYVTLDNGNVTGTSDHTSTTGQTANDPFTDTYLVRSDGTFQTGSSGTNNYVGIAISANKLVKIDHETLTEPSILVIEK
jgi:hypothetical protein